MKRSAAFLLLCAFVGLAQPASTQPSPDEIQEIMAELTRISGLKQLKKVEFERIAKDQVKGFIEQQIKDTVKPEEIRSEELTLRKFGFVPAGFDLKETTIALLSEQAAAFYDFRKRKLFLIDAGSEMLQHSALVHELAHALADQHFHLEKFIEKGRQSDDGSLARLAVMEGQATWLMSEYLTQRTGQSLKDAPLLVKMMSRMAEASTGQFPVFEKAPLYLRETLLFPYTQGMLFQHAVFEKLGQAAFTDVFRRAPVSTQQILHPEKYLAGTAPAPSPLPPFDAREYRTLAEGTMGEIDHSILFRQYGDKEGSETVSPNWTGAQYRLLERKKGGRQVLLYSSEWAGSEAAREAFHLYQRALKGKWASYEPSSATEAEIRGRGDDGYFLLRLDGVRVSSVEGLETPEDARSR